MKKIFTALLVLSMLFVLTACGGDKKPTPSDSVVQSGGNQEEMKETENKAPVSTGKITVDIVDAHPANPESDFEIEEVEDGKAEIVTYLGDDEIVTIPAELKGYTVIGVGKLVFANETPIKGIKLSDSIEYIGKSVCALNPNLQVFIGGSGLKTIGDAAFQGCQALTDVIIRSDLTTIENYAFSECKNLKSLELPSSVIGLTEMVFAFRPEDFTLIAPAGSEVEAFAQRRNINFQAK